MLKQFATSFFILISFFAFNQINEVRRITKTLCSPEFHGRGYVERGDSLAANYIASEFKKLGVEGYEGSYFQNFSLPVNTFPGRMSVILNERALTPGEHYIVDQGSKGYTGELSLYKIDAQSAMNQDLLMDAVREVMEKNVYNGIILDFAGADKDTLAALRGLGNELRGIMNVVEIVDSKFMWSVSQQQAPNLHLYMQDSVYSANASIKVDIQAKFISDYSSQNVVAYLPSKKKCAKTLVYTAHYDHLGRMGMDTYFPGANDNASGTAMLLTMAKYFKENPSKYNIMFIAFAGEEAGLVGSKYFVENPLIKLKKIKFLVNLDIMGSGEEGITVVNATLFEDEFKLLQSISEKENLLAQVKSRGPAANSDHYWFTKNNVPAFFIYTMGPNKNYHDIFDRYEELSFNEYNDITTLLIEFAKAL